MLYADAAMAQGVRRPRIHDVRAQPDVADHRLVAGARPQPPPGGRWTGRRCRRDVLLRRLRARDDGRRHHARPGAVAAVDAVPDRQGTRRRPQPVARRRCGRSPSGPPPAVRCSVCGSPTTRSSATASRRCVSCWATRSSRSSSRVPRQTDHSVLTEQRDDAERRPACSTSSSRSSSPDRRPRRTWLIVHRSGSAAAGQRAASACSLAAR